MAQLVELAAIAPVERLLVLGPDSPLLAALVAEAAELQPRPIAVLTDHRGSDTDADVNLMRALAHRLPLADASVDIALAPHQLRHWDDGLARRTLEELWRVLAHNGVVVLWEIAPSKSARLNAVWERGLSLNGRRPQLRRFGEVGRLAYDAGFAWVQTLPLRPFFWPPGPRLTVLARKEHYGPEHIVTRDGGPLGNC